MMRSLEHEQKPSTGGVSSKGAVALVELLCLPPPLCPRLRVRSDAGNHGDIVVGISGEKESMGSMNGGEGTGAKSVL